MSKSESQEWGILTVRLVKSLGQAVDTNELEWVSSVKKINSKTSKVIRSGIGYKWVRVRIKSERLTVRLIKSLCQALDTNKSEWESRLG